MSLLCLNGHRMVCISTRNERFHVYRRYRCLVCGARASTNEVLASSIKRGPREAFDQATGNRITVVDHPLEALQGREKERE